MSDISFNERKRTELSQSMALKFPHTPLQNGEVGELLTQKGTILFFYGENALVAQRKNATPGRKGVKISVKPEGAVEVLATEETEDEAIKELLKRRSGWIYRSLLTFYQHRKGLQPRQYISGESHFYLGRRHLLKVLEEEGAETESVKLERGRLVIRLKAGAYSAEIKRERVKTLLTNWYREKAREYFKKRLREIAPKMPWIGNDALPKFRLRSMKTQWGSCSARGVLTLNPHLIKAHQEAVDYVLVHELCHLKEHNHSPQFYRLLEQYLPRWRETKKALDEKAYIYLNGV